MTELLDRYRPDWVDAAATVSAAGTDGLELSLTPYESGWDTGQLLVTASGADIAWQAAVGMAELAVAIDSAGERGIDADVDIAGEAVPVRLVEDVIEIPIGPFLVTGAYAEWRQVLDRERTEAQPLSQLPPVDAVAWTGDRIRFPVTSSE